MPPSLRRYFRHGLLPQLMVFEAVSRLESVTRAAEELHLAQPTVSTQMKKLTAALGVPLLQQHGRHLRLTPAGEALAVTSKELRELFVRLEARLAALRGNRPELVRLAAVPAGRHLAARLLATFCARHPGVQASLYVGGSAEIQGRLALGEDDLCVVLSSWQSNRVGVTPVATELLYVYAPAQHPLADARSIPPAALAAEAFVLREPGSAIRETLLRACALNPAQMIVRAELASNEAIAEAIARGVGIGLLPESEAQAFVQTDSIVPLDVVGFPQQRHWGLARTRGKRLSVTAELFLRESLDGEKSSADMEHDALT